MVREIFLQEINDLPILADYNKYRRDTIAQGNNPMSIKRFRKDWQKEAQEEIRVATGAPEREDKTFKKLDEIR